MVPALFFLQPPQNKKPISEGAEMGLHFRTRLFWSDYARCTLSAGKLSHQHFTKEQTLIRTFIVGSMSLAALEGQDRKASTKI